MANTYTKCYFQLVFAVKNRDVLIKKQWKDNLEKYITGIVQNHHHKMLAIGAMPDHMHILLGYNLNHLIPDLVEEIKIHPTNGLRKKDYQGLILRGRKVMEHSHILMSRLTLLQDIFYPRKSITNGGLSRKNISNY